MQVFPLRRRLEWLIVRVGRSLTFGPNPTVSLSPMLK